MKKKLFLGISLITLLIAACNNPFLQEKDNSSNGNEKTYITEFLSHADVHITSPAKNEVPHSEAAVEADANYTAGEVSWSPEHTPFRGETVYTATVTLTAKDGYLFAEEDIEALINGNDTTEIIENTGDTITLSLVFAPTLNKEITGITVVSQPEKITYIHGEKLDVTGLVVNITYDDGTDEDLTPEDFHSRNISVNPPDGTELHRSTHDGQPLVVSLGEENAETDALIVNKIGITITTGTPNRTLIPFNSSDTTYSDSASVSITVTGLIDSNPVSVIVGTNSYGVTSSALNITGTTGTLTINYNGATVTQTTAVSIPVTLNQSEIYELSTPSSFSVLIIDGVTSARAIPVTTNNRTQFNTYVNTANGLTRHYKLMENITLTANWTAIGTSLNSFTGSFNGQGYAITNMTINTTSNDQGMFGRIGLNGSVKNLGLVNVNIKGGSNTGGIAGGFNSSGMIENCYTTGIVQGTSSTGGIVGYGNTIRNSYSICRVIGTVYTGGVIGYLESGYIEYCYSRGTVSGTSNVGGIAGYNEFGPVRNCIALNPSISGTAASTGRITGYSDSTLSNNRALSGINIRINNTPKTISNSPTGIDGSSASLATLKTQTTWSTGAGFTFSTSLWKWDANNMPYLYNERFPWSVAVEMVLVQAGSFTMGANSNSNVTPTHQVTLTQNYYIGKYEVTQEEYLYVVGNNPSGFLSNATAGEVQNRRPVEMVSWYNALVFCNMLSMMEGYTPAYRINNSTNPDDWGAVPTSSNATWNAATIVSGSTGYRLPTEAQWEYAARGRTETFQFSGGNSIFSVAWFNDNAGGKTHQVGLKTPNGLGLYDMSGNVCEWVWDWNSSYTSTAKTDPTGPASGTNRLIRGGGWYNWDIDCRPVRRYDDPPSFRDRNLGFRISRP